MLLQKASLRHVLMLNSALLGEPAQYCINGYLDRGLLLGKPEAPLEVLISPQTPRDPQRAPVTTAAPTAPRLAALPLRLRTLNAVHTAEGVAEGVQGARFRVFVPREVLFHFLDNPGQFFGDSVSVLLFTVRPT